MCGIIGAINPYKHQTDVNQEVIDQYQTQRSRGTEGFGIITVDKNMVVQVHRSTIETKAIIDVLIQKAPMVFMHHRMPTSTKNTLQQTHPIEVSHPKAVFNYLVIHNGIINNSKEIHEKHIKEGFEYTTLTEPETQWGHKFNDSEAIAIDFVRFIEFDKKPLSMGSVAAIILQIDKKTNKLQNIFFYRKTNAALNLSINRNIIRIASIGKGNEVKENLLYKVNIKDYSITKTEFILPEYKYTPETPHKHNYTNSLSNIKKQSHNKHKILPKTTSPIEDIKQKYSDDEDINEILDTTAKEIQCTIAEYLSFCATQDEFDSEIEGEGNSQYIGKIAEILINNQLALSQEYDAKSKQKIGTFTSYPPRTRNLYDDEPDAYTYPGHLA